jgi:hypothetical protein
METPFGFPGEARKHWPTGYREVNGEDNEKGGAKLIDGETSAGPA